MVQTGGALHNRIRERVRTAIKQRGLSPYRAAVAAQINPDRTRAFLAGGDLRGVNLTRLMESLDVLDLRESAAGRSAER